ncbi:hypothetical protein [Pseudomarimonas arenosa]|uniref:Uncharacterized protein n=1 Tax=Pseudomarimonas arenosa TaxID=2774145 RepID=A0AAW3ZM08_9GAMM|nr:hypothetical protein [Pseudomarimonas arenosa]MBD8526212.1 hypothetical protein [Pseudomarimonas arenosa]
MSHLQEVRVHIGDKIATGIFWALGGTVALVPASFAIYIGFKFGPFWLGLCGLVVFFVAALGFRECYRAFVRKD